MRSAPVLRATLEHRLDMRTSLMLLARAVLSVQCTMIALPNNISITSPGALSLYGSSTCGDCTCQTLSVLTKVWGTIGREEAGNQM